MQGRSSHDLVAESAFAPRISRRATSSEKALVRAARRGSADASERLARLHWPTAHRLAYLITRDRGAAEDVAQESILTALGSLHRFDGRRRLRPWLHQIVTNRSIDWLRARERRREVELDPARLQVEAPEEDVAAAIESLGRLDDKTRAIVVLRCLLDYKPREIAPMMEMTSGAVRTRLHRGLAELRGVLGEEEK